VATTLLQIEEEAYQDDLGMSLGTLGKSSSGRVRGPLIDSKTKARISKTLQVLFIYIVMEELMMFFTNALLVA